MRLQSITSWIALAACAALAPSAFAQTDDPERDIIVVTGSATPVEYEKLGQTLSVISSELIED